MLSREASRTVSGASIIARKMDDEYVSIEHLLLAIFDSKSPVAQAIKDQGVTKKNLEMAIEELRKGERVTSQTAEDTYNALNKYALNLNEIDRKSTRLNSSHVAISYAVFCLKKKKKQRERTDR